jgi:hypothetical protein
MDGSALGGSLHMLAKTANHQKFLKIVDMISI